ncbi:MAG: GDP-mannose 4,6-dehydratase [Candidatus Diapherotrites archaeon]|nr:GDP-mannose 4,6-dehydratase [Candidatus Diapherotrites archaeon]
MPKVLITGINGFVGSHLAQHVIGIPDAELFGLLRNKNSDVENVKEIFKQINFLYADILNYQELFKVIKTVEPDYVFHLAAQPFVQESWRDPRKTFEVNVIGSINLLEALRNAGIDAKIHLASTSEVYGQVKKNELPVTEQNQLRPFSPYGASKLAMEFLAQQYFKNYGLKIFITRAFNHSGPKSPRNYILSDWSRQVAFHEKGRLEYLSVGNLTVERDFSDVRDVVRAYWLVAKNGKAGEPYNVCSGASIKMAQILKKLQVLANSKLKVKKDSKKFRLNDLKTIVGSNEKILKATGWKPQIPFNQTIKDTLNYWRLKVN